MIHWAPLPKKFLLFLWYHCHPGVIMFVLCLARRYKFLFHIYLLPLAGAVSSRMFPYPYVALVSQDLSPREERQLKIFSYGASWLRPPSLWTKARATTSA